MVNTSYNPSTTNARVVPKSRGPGRTLEFSEERVILKYLLSLSNKQVDELHKSSEEIEGAKKTLDKVLVSEEDEEMYIKMMKENMKQVAKEDKEKLEEKLKEDLETEQEIRVNRIRQKHKSRKIPMGKPIGQVENIVSWNHNNGEKATPTTKISIHSLQHY